MLRVCVFLATTQSQVNTSAALAANMATAVSMPLIFGDERDSVIAKWNQLQAFWGTGRGHYNSQGHFVDFTPDNPFSFFKVVLYPFFYVVCLPFSALALLIWVPGRLVVKLLLLF